MKKFFALLLTVCLLFCFSVTAFAAVSPVASKKYAVVMLIDDGTAPTKQSYEVSTEIIGEMEILNFTAHEPKAGSTFDGWSFYRKDGSVAIIDSEYIVIDGNTLSLNVKFIPFTDLIVVAQYDGKKPDLTEAMKLFDTTSPQTGDPVPYFLAGLFVVCVGGAVVTKKQLAK